jgi:hypothetical protein
MAPGDTNNRHTAKSAYDGVTARLRSAIRTSGCDAVDDAAHHQSSTTGAAAIPHTSVCTAISDTTVHVIRHATTDGGEAILVSAAISGVSDA